MSDARSSSVTEEMVNTACGIYERVYIDDDKSMHEAMRDALIAVLGAAQTAPHSDATALDEAAVLRVVESMIGQFESMRNGYKGYLPWREESSEVRTRLMHIEDGDKAFFASVVKLKSMLVRPAQASTPPQPADPAYGSLETREGCHIHDAID